MGSGSEFQIVGAANENADLKPYFFNFADGIVRSLLETDLIYKLLYSVGLQHFCYVGRCMC